jgi:hypothetical protein
LNLEYNGRISADLFEAVNTLTYRLKEDDIKVMTD